MMSKQTIGWITEIPFQREEVCFLNSEEIIDIFLYFFITDKQSYKYVYVFSWTFRIDFKYIMIFSGIKSIVILVWLFDRMLFDSRLTDLG